MGLFGFFKKFGSLLKRALSVVEKFVPEETIQLALNLVEDVEDRFNTNAERREYVVKILVENFRIPESIARLAVELAVQLYKRRG